MKKMNLVLVATAAVLTALVGILYLRGAIKPERPETTSQSLVMPHYDSSIDVPVSIHLKKLQEILEASAPKTLSGRANVDIGGNVSGEHVNWAVSRSPIIVAESDGSISLSTEVSGDATLHWKYCPVGTGLGSIGCSNGQESADIAASVTALVSDIRVGPDWKLTAKLTPRVDVTEAESRILGLIKVSFKSELQDSINKAIPKVRAAFGDFLDQLEIQQQVEEAWASTNHILKVSDDPSIWVVLEPKAVAVAPITVSQNQVSTAARLVASVKTVLGDQPADPKGSFPNLVDMPQAPPAFALHVPLHLSMSSLSDQANKCCLPLSVPMGSETLTLRDFKLTEGEGRLIIETKFRTGWFGAHGTMYLEATPRLSADHNTLEIHNLDFDIRTREKLLDGAAEIAKPAVLEAIAGELRIDLRPLYESGLADVRKRASDLKVAEGIEVTTDIKSVALDDVVVGNGQLVVIAAATGTVSVTVPYVAHSTAAPISSR